jgi:hypothetical protein
MVKAFFEKRIYIFLEEGRSSARWPFSDEK